MTNWHCFFLFLATNRAVYYLTHSHHSFQCWWLDCGHYACWCWSVSLTLIKILLWAPNNCIIDLVFWFSYANVLFPRIPCFSKKISVYTDILTYELLVWLSSSSVCAMCNSHTIIWMIYGWYVQHFNHVQHYNSAKTSTCATSLPPKDMQYVHITYYFKILPPIATNIKLLLTVYISLLYSVCMLYIYFSSLLYCVFLVF